jgi:hypothetical protein
MTDNGKALVQTLVEIYGRIGDFHIVPCDGAIPISEADRLAEKAVEDYTNAILGKAQVDIEKLKRDHAAAVKEANIAKARLKGVEKQWHADRAALKGSK